MALEFDLSGLADPMALLQILGIILILGVILSAGAVVACNMKASNDQAQGVIDNNCKAILNFAKFLPIIGNMG